MDIYMQVISHNKTLSKVFYCLDGDFLPQFYAFRCWSLLGDTAMGPPNLHF